MPASQPDARFLVTPELNRLARWLRLLGFDTVIAKDNVSKALARQCSLQNRILLTRLKNPDKIRYLRDYIFIESDSHSEQLKQVVNQLNLKKFCLFCRCIYCNRTVRSIPKTSIEDKLPEKVKQRETSFTICKKCERIYWKGDHFKSILQFLNSELVELIGTKLDEFVLTEFS